MNTLKVIGIIVILALIVSFFYSILTIRNTVAGTIVKLRIEPIPVFAINENVIEDVEWNITLTAQTKNMPKQVLYKGFDLTNDNNEDLFERFGTDIQYKVVLKVMNMTDDVLFEEMNVFTNGHLITYHVYLNQSHVNEQIKVEVTIRYCTLIVPPPIDKTVNKEPEEINLTTVVELSRW